MLVVGITGGPATGKSLVTRRLHALGAVAFSADEAARAVLTSALTVQIAEAFSGVLTADKGLDRAALGRRVFADPAARARLERMTHPPILRLLHAQIDACRNDLPGTTVVAVEVPLLFETHLESWFERIVVVTASESVQSVRLHTRNGLEEAEAHRRVTAQWPLALKAERADDVLVNDGSLEELYRAVDALWVAWRGLDAPQSEPQAAV